MLNNVTYINWNDDDDNDLLVSQVHQKRYRLLLRGAKKCSPYYEFSTSRSIILGRYVFV